MKYIDEYRDNASVQRLSSAIHAITTRPHCIMEICGGQTHAIVKYGLDTLLPASIRLIHGPGCPVCVTSSEIIDSALAMAQQPGVIFCSFGDMLRVPGSSSDLLRAKANGADVRMLYSPLDAVTLARQNPDRDVIFFAIGFETTAPANAMAVLQAEQLGLRNFFLLVAHVLVPPAMHAMLASPRNQVQGFLAAGHVCAVMGMADYQPLVDRFKVPIVITGFEPVDILQGIYLCVQQLENNQYRLENQYARAVRSEGNLQAQKWISQVFEVVPQRWRGIGDIADSGLGLRPRYAAFDAQKKFPLPNAVTAACTECISGEILQGLRKPAECPAFARRCTPEQPLGAPMVSSEGACAAYYRYRRGI
jgi:hydrogenase expression/formation protein HypD